MAEATGDDKIVEGSKDVRVLNEDRVGSEAALGVEEVDVVEIERVYRYLSLLAKRGSVID